MHIDDFVDDFQQKDKYVQWFFFLHRLPAVKQASFSEWILTYKLFCDYKGKRYRCTGASRLGDIWLAEDFERETGYDLRVDITECSNFKPVP